MVVPLSDAVIAILESLPRFNKGDHLFSTDFGNRPVNGFSKAKVILDEAILAELRKDNPKAKLAPFVIHDIRPRNAHRAFGAAGAVRCGRACYRSLAARAAQGL